MGVDNSIKLIIEPSKSYLKQVKNLVKSNQISHYFFDPRTGSQSFLTSIFQSLYLSVYFSLNQITPIVLLTDFSVRRWRIQSSIITAKKGLVITYLDVKIVKELFPHNRIIGPFLMPFSKKTLKEISFMEKGECDYNSALFIGSLYEPRRSTLLKIAVGLENSGYSLKIKGRELGGKRVSDHEYWSNLINGNIIVTTAMPINKEESPDLQDWNWVPQLVYRYVEAIACRSLLIAPNVPGVEKYFNAGEHFVAYDGIDDAIEKIKFYINHKDEHNKIVYNGYNKIQSLINSNFFWLTIDLSLGPNGLK
jgi:hypothetical protein